MRVLTVPNIITLIRIIIIPVFVIAMVYERYPHALILFAVAGLSDALDGLLARAVSQKTTLGAFLDPLADKFLLVTSFILFSVYGWIPTWLTIIVLSRDVIVTMGWALISILYHRTKVQPSLTGKAAIASQIILISYALLGINFAALPAPAALSFWIVAGLTIASGLQYIYREFTRAGEK